MQLNKVQRIDDLSPTMLAVLQRKNNHREQAMAILAQGSLYYFAKDLADEISEGKLDCLTLVNLSDSITEFLLKCELVTSIAKGQGIELDDRAKSEILIFSGITKYISTELGKAQLEYAEILPEGIKKITLTTRGHVNVILGSSEDSKVSS